MTLAAVLLHPDLGVGPSDQISHGPPFGDVFHRAGKFAEAGWLVMLGNKPTSPTRVKMMKVEQTGLPGVILIEPKRFGDNRGYFAETYNEGAYRDAGVERQFVQDNHSLSEKIGTVRGLHFQNPPSAQAKLVRCGRGAIFDVAVDIRVGSQTYGKWVGYELSADNGLQLFIPAGFAHGFMTLKPDSEIVYKCSDYYAPETEGSVRWDDPDLAIQWPKIADPVLSPKDAEAPLLSQIESPFRWETAR